MATIKSIFGTYADKLQVMIDKANDKFAPTWFQNFFDVATPQPTLDFKSVIGRSRIQAAASVSARGSKKPVRSRAGLDAYSGNIPSITEKIHLSEDDMRQFLMLQNMAVSDETKKKQILDFLFADVKTVGDAAMKRIDIMCLEAVSTGKISLTLTNNPDGIVLANALDLLMPSGNKVNAAVTWATAGSATPITDIQGIVNTARAKGISFDRILMDYTAWFLFIKTTEVKDQYGNFLGKSNNKTFPTFDTVNDFLRSQKLPIIEIVDQVIGIEKDGVTNTITPWETTNIAFIPAGQLGEIKNAVSIEEIKPIDQVNYGKFRDLALISKWGDTDPYQEWTGVEANAFPTLTVIDSIYLLSRTVAF
jgi:hypothetical protein